MNNIILSGDTVTLDSKVKSAKIEVKKDSVLNVINPYKNLDLNIVVDEQVSLNLNLFNNIGPVIINMNIESKDSSKLIFNASFIAEERFELNIEANLYGDNISNNVNIRGINEERGIVTIKMNGTVAGETKNNVINEYARIINNSDDTNVLIPNLVVNTSEVIANHGVSIGNISNQELFYLISKGINNEDAIKLIEKGFLLSIMSDDIKDIIKNILIGR